MVVQEAGDSEFNMDKNTDTNTDSNTDTNTDSNPDSNTDSGFCVLKKNCDGDARGRR